MSLMQTDQRLVAAHTAFVRGDRQQAFALYDALLRESPDDLRVLLDAGAAHFTTFEDFEEAARLFERAVQVAPTSVEARLWLADVSSYGYAGGYAAAARLYRAALRDALQPDDVADAAIGVYSATRAPDQAVSLSDALTTLREAQSVAPERADVPLALGYGLFAAGEVAAAQRSLRESEEIYQRQQSKQAGIPRRALERIAQTGKLSSTTLVVDSPRQRRWLPQT